MKFGLNKTHRTFSTIAICLLIGACLFSAADSGHAQGLMLTKAQARDPIPPPMTLTPFTSTIQAGVTNAAATTNAPASAYSWNMVTPGNMLMVLQVPLTGSAAGTSNVTVNVYGSLDGVTATTSSIASQTVALNGTNTVVANLTMATNLPTRFFFIGGFTSAQTNVVTVGTMLIAFIPL